MKTSLLDCKPSFTSIDSQLPLEIDDSGDDFEDVTQYRRQVRKLIYLTVTRPDLSFTVGVVSQYMQKPKICHWNAVLKILHYI